MNQVLEKMLEELPEVQAGKDLWQNRFHEFDVFDHTMEYVRYLKEMTEDDDLIAAGYLHDIGKPMTAITKVKEGKIQEKEPGKPYHKFTDHEKAGEDMVRRMNPDFFREFGLNQERIAKLVGSHYTPMRGVKGMREATRYQDFEKAYEDLIRSLDETGVPRNEVMTMFLADSLAKGKSCSDIGELRLVRQVILADGENLRDIYDLQKEMYGGKE